MILFAMIIKFILKFTQNNDTIFILLKIEYFIIYEWMQKLLIIYEIQKK